MSRPLPGTSWTIPIETEGGDGRDRATASRWGTTSSWVIRTVLMTAPRNGAAPGGTAGLAPGVW